MLSAKYPDGTENSKLPNPSLSELPDEIEKLGLPKLPDKTADVGDAAGTYSEFALISNPPVPIDPDAGLPLF